MNRHYKKIVAILLTVALCFTQETVSFAGEISANETARHIRST